MKIKELARVAQKRVREDKDLVIAFTGNEGDGKSGLSINTGLAIDPSFNVNTHLLYSPTVEEAKQKIYGLPKFSFVGVDEAIKIMYKLNWGTKLSKYLNVIYGICRKQNQVSGLCMPRFTDFNEYFRNHRIRLWVHIFDPVSLSKDWGEAAVMVRSWNPITSDPWGIVKAERAFLKLSKYKKITNFEMRARKTFFSKLESFVDFLDFGYVEQSMWDEYNLLKDKFSVPDELDGETEKNEVTKWKDRTSVATKALIKLGYTQAQVAKLYGVSTASVNSWVKPVIQRT